MTVDAVIVGSGPAGATVADVLTEAGWSVVIFEKGRNHLIDLGRSRHVSSPTTRTTRSSSSTVISSVRTR